MERGLVSKQVECNDATTSGSKTTSRLVILALFAMGIVGCLTMFGTVKHGTSFTEVNLRIRVLSENGEPRKNVTVRYLARDGSLRAQGRTDDKGVVQMSVDSRYTTSTCLGIERTTSPCYVGWMSTEFEQVGEKEFCIDGVNVGESSEITIRGVKVFKEGVGKIDHLRDVRRASQ